MKKSKSQRFLSKNEDFIEDADILVKKSIEYLLSHAVLTN